MSFHLEPYVSVDNYRDRVDKLVILIKETIFWTTKCSNIILKIQDDESPQNREKTKKIFIVFASYKFLISGVVRDIF